SKLKEHMQYCVDHPEEISKLAKVKAQVSEVKGFLMVLASGTRFQAARDKDEEEDVDAEYEDKADCLGHYHCTDPHHNLVSLPWLQMLI
ncbi:hypothetical protein BHE74_00051338, partial [Ensete ventricosum]